MGCHGNPTVERAPSPAVIREMSPEHIYDVVSTDHGFRCQARFPQQALSRRSRKLGTKLGSGGVVVRLEVRNIDIHAIAVQAAAGSDEMLNLYGDL